MLYIYSRSPRELSKALARPWGRSDVLRAKREAAAREAESEKTAAYRARLTRKPVESSRPKSASQICGVINDDAVEGVVRFAGGLRKLQMGEPLTAEEKAIPCLPDLTKYPGHPQPAKAAQRNIERFGPDTVNHSAAKLVSDLASAQVRLHEQHKRNELLAACKALLDSPNITTCPDGAWSTADDANYRLVRSLKAAIAKAEGRTE